MAKSKGSEVEQNIAVIANDLGYIKMEIKEIKDRLDKNYVTLERFAPLEKLVYGVVGVIGTAFVTAVAYFFINIKK